MNDKIVLTIAAAIGLYLCGAQPLRAEPMKCSGEQKTCIATCAKYSNGAVASKCVQGCYASQSICIKNRAAPEGAARRNQALRGV
jgi:hypothetical protein